jgi:hypothetical protein
MVRKSYCMEDTLQGDECDHESPCIRVSSIPRRHADIRDIKKQSKTCFESEKFAYVSKWHKWDKHWRAGSPDVSQ